MSLVRGIPQVMWAAKRLGAQVFAVCADITNANVQLTFWLCVQLEPERWRVVEVLAVSTDGTAPACWQTAAVEHMPQLIHPTPPTAHYIVEGIDA